jgi:thiamine pyrophosphokinase
MSNERAGRAVVFAGGNLGSWALERLEPDDCLIGADRGSVFLVQSGLRPDLALGDFDSTRPEELEAVRSQAAELRMCDPVDKDWTDTELAFREAIRRGFRRIAVVGGLGTRFDHSLANVHLLRQAADAGCDACLLDEHNEIRLCTESLRLRASERFPYVSLLPLTPTVTGVTLSGFRYPLRNATLTLGWSLGVSNALEAAEGVVTIAEGLLLVIRSRD